MVTEERAQASEVHGFNTQERKGAAKRKSKVTEVRSFHPFVYLYFLRAGMVGGGYVFQSIFLLSAALSVQSMQLERLHLEKNDKSTIRSHGDTTHFERRVMNCSIRAAESTETQGG